MGKDKLVAYTKNGGGKSVPKELRQAEVVIYDVVGSQLIESNSE